MGRALDIFADYSADDANLVLAATVADRAVERTRSGLLVYSAHHAGRVLADESLWSDRSSSRRLDTADPAHRQLFESTRGFFAKWPVFSDGEYHDRVRSAIVRGLRRLSLAQAEPAWKSFATRRITELRGERFDWMADVARPVAEHAVSSIVGDDAAQLIAWGSVLIDELATPALQADRAAETMAAISELHGWLDAQIRAGRGATAPLVAELSALWNSPAAGPEAATAALAQVVTGAYDPVVATVGLIGESLDRAALRTLPLETLRDEALRLATPFRFTSRYPRRPVTIGGHRLSIGDRVVIGLATANLDPTAFPHPLRWANRSGSARSFTFGGGRHYCPGVGIAKGITGSLLGSLSASDLVFQPESVIRAPELPIRRYQAIHGYLA
ncbi:cytochrome P450 [Kribbella sp. DT2]|uniref:cytochrome P450 n=1 Tax=Kribbella sp. DT2 TaxID=3393427 RepID=UPI003CF85086